MSFDDIMSLFNTTEEEQLLCLKFLCEIRLKKLYISMGEKGKDR